jgi:hypothetical protein
MKLNFLFINIYFHQTDASIQIVDKDQKALEFRGYFLQLRNWLRSDKFSVASMKYSDIESMKKLQYFSQI